MTQVAPPEPRAEPLPWKASADLDTDRLHPSAPRDAGRADNSTTGVPRAGPVSSWPTTPSPHVHCCDLWGGRRKPLFDLGSNFFHKFSSIKEPWTLGYNGGKSDTAFLPPSPFFKIFCVAGGILVPWPWINPVPPALGARNLNHWTTRKSPHAHFQMIRNQWEGGVSGWHPQISNTNSSHLFSLLIPNISLRG